MIKRKYLIWTGLSLALIALIGYGFWPRPTPVDVTTVSRGPMQVVLEEEGRTHVRDRYVISTPVNGYVHRLGWKVGDAVSAGQVMFTVEPAPSPILDPRSHARAQARVEAARAALDRAREQVSAAEADAEFAEQERDRVEQLFDSSAATRQMVDAAVREARRAQAQLVSAELGVEVARHDLEAAQTALAYAETNPANRPAESIDIRAPSSGRILSVKRESEGVVQTGQPLLEIGDPQQIEVVTEVLSSDAVRITPGMHVQFERWGGNSTLKGQVRTIEPVGYTKISALGVEEQRVRVISDFASLSTEGNRLGDGYRIISRFVLWEGDDVLQLPSSALFRQDDNWAVFVIEDGRAHLRMVEPGHRSGLSVEIVDGLEAGTEVIDYPDQAIEEGSRVEPR